MVVSAVNLGYLPIPYRWNLCAILPGIMRAVDGKSSWAVNLGLLWFTSLGKLVVVGGKVLVALIESVDGFTIVGQFVVVGGGRG
ncbi:hypothetical protein [Corynebacterium auriscanis]|uniref:hypothetical protein n=1 Tax=Corynebacterium auriscanis TaxID=99807 RepID=UPI0024AD02EE|nr:hypothetical protein [Corynebacterium auriscanis]